MVRYLHTLSAVLFYVLAGSMFLAYVLAHNDIWQPQATLWMNVGDLPLLLTSILYGGTSVYLSLKDDTAPSPILGTLIALPLLVVFGFFVILNFWTLFAS